MATFDWPTDLVPFAQSFWIQPHTGGTESPFSRVTKTYGLGAPRWVCSMSFRGGYNSSMWGTTDAALLGQRMDALLDHLRGREGRVYLWDMRRSTMNAPGWTGGVTNSAAVAGSSTMTLSGLTAGQLAVRRGEYVGGDGRPHRILADVTASSTGTATIWFEPPLINAVAAGAAIFGNPKGLFMLTGDDAGDNMAEVGELTHYNLEFVEVVGQYASSPTTFSDSTAPVNQGAYYQALTLSRTVYSTTATRIQITGYNNIATSFPEFAHISVRYNGYNAGYIQATAEGQFSGTVNLPAGQKTVEIINGLQSLPDILRGTWFVSATANAPLTQITPAVGTRSVFLVDSIGAGGNSSDPGNYGYIPILRRYTTDSLVAYGYGYGSLFLMAGDSTKRAALVSDLVALAPAKVVITLGTNDYGLALWSAASFQTAYGDLLDAIHTALPSASILAVKPILRSSEVANSFGDTLGAYRTAISSAASGKAWVTVVDGSTFLLTSDLADGLHPTTAGQRKFAEAIDSSLGYTVPSLPTTTTGLTATDANGTVTLNTPVAGTHRATKTGGGTAFNSGFYTPIDYDNFRYSVKVSVNGDIMIGVNEIPQSSSDFTDMRHQIYLNINTNVEAYDGSTRVGVVGTWGDPTTFWVDRTGSVLTFRKGLSYTTSVLLRSVPGVVGPLSLDLSVSGVGAVLDVTKVI